MSPAARLLPGIILAGGQSQRMGRNKALEPLGGLPLLRRIIDRLSGQVTSLAISGGAEADWAMPYGVPVIADRHPGRLGPLAGIAAGLGDIAARIPDASHLLTVPADSPFFPRDLAQRMHACLDGQDQIVVAASQGRLHPVFGLWPVALAADLDDFLRTDDRRRVRDFMARHHSRIVDFPQVETPHGPIDPFFNINTPEDLVRAAQWLESLTA